MTYKYEKVDKKLERDMWGNKHTTKNQNKERIKFYKNSAERTAIVVAKKVMFRQQILGSLRGV